MRNVWAQPRNRLFIKGVACAVAAWHLLAVVVFVFRPSANDDITPDAYVYMSAAEHAEVFLGARDGAAVLPITLGAPTSNAQEPSVEFTRLRPTLREEEAVMTVSAFHDEFGVIIPSAKVKWVNGDAKTIAITFDDNYAEALYTGTGYNYGRFITLRGAKSVAYVPANGHDGNGFTYMSPGRLIEEHATSIVITVPLDDPDWKRARGIS